MRRGSSLPLWGSGVSPPEIFFENSDAKSCILVASALINGLPMTCISEQTTKSWGTNTLLVPNLKVGGPVSPGPHGCCACGVKGEPSNPGSPYGYYTSLCLYFILYSFVTNCKTELIATGQFLRKVIFSPTCVWFYHLFNGIYFHFHFASWEFPPACTWCIVCDSINRPGDLASLTF